MSIELSASGHPFMYDDAVRVTSGSIYKVIGDLHPRWGAVGLLEYVPVENGRKKGFEKTFDFRIPETGQYIPPQYPQFNIPLYNRALEVIPHGEILEHYRPEDIIATMRSGNGNCQAGVPDIIESLLDICGIGSCEVGINGSVMLGLSDEYSNINLDIIGADACETVFRFMMELGRKGNIGNFYAADARQGRLQDAFKGFLRDAFPDVLKSASAIAVREGRVRTCGFYETLPFTVQYHGWSRGKGVPDIITGGWTFERRTIVRATIAEPNGYAAYHTPAFVCITEVLDTLLNVPLNVSGLISFSKRFWFVNPGDIVEFTADVLSLDEELRLAVPGFGGNWVFRFISRTPWASSQYTALP